MEALTSKNVHLVENVKNRTLCILMTNCNKLQQEIFGWVSIVAIVRWRKYGTTYKNY